MTIPASLFLRKLVYEKLIEETDAFLLLPLPTLVVASFGSPCSAAAAASAGGVSAMYFACIKVVVV